MTIFLTLIQREWLQHRFGWTLLALVPLAISLPLLGFADVQFGDGGAVRMADSLPIFITIVSLLATVAVMLMILWGASLVQVSGLARRDHGDRSIEFWLSLPVGHTPSLAVPLLVHLLLVPLAALLLGIAGGTLVSLVLVWRAEGVAAWFALPWGALLPAVLAAAARLAVGIALATLWLLPLLMLAVLAGAWFKRWAVPVLIAVFGLGGLLLEQLFGNRLLNEWASTLFVQAGRSLLNAGATPMVVQGSADVLAGLQAAPEWALADLGDALGLALSPVFALGLLVSAACFAALVQWRRRV